MSLSAYARNGLVNTILRNTPLVVPVFAASLHDGDPLIEGGSAAGTLIDTAVERAPITSSAAVNGNGANTGDPASWEIEESTTITHIGLHDALASGNWLGREPVAQPVQVADGDTVRLTTFTVTMPES